MTDLETTAGERLSTRAAKNLDAMRVGDPRGDTGERLPTRGCAGRPHPVPLGALGVCAAGKITS